MISVLVSDVFVSVVYIAKRLYSIFTGEYIEMESMCMTVLC